MMLAGAGHYFLSRRATMCIRLSATSARCEESG
jgi:hypothetical protein